MTRHGTWLVPSVVMLLLAPLLAACGAPKQPVEIVPAGAAQGLPTLIYVYTEN